MSSYQSAAATFVENLTLIVPIVGMLLLPKKTGSWVSFLTGLLMYLLYLLLLTPLMNLLVLGVLSLPFISFPRNSLGFSIFYTILSVTLEELLHLVLLRWIYRSFVRARKPSSDISLGLGYGCGEAVMNTGLPMLANMALVSQSVISAEEMSQDMLDAAEVMRGTPVADFLFLGLEALAFIAIQTACCILVAHSLQEGQRKFLGIAIAAHALVSVTKLVMDLYFPIMAVAITLAVLSAAAVLFALRIRKPIQAEPEEGPRLSAR